VSGTRIQLVLSDDWELRGDGSGNMRAIQFETLRRVCEIYERHGLRGSFNVEVFQQIVHRRLQARHPELGRLADEWEEAVRDAYRRGHDVQLHLHPQWSRAEYADGRWRLAAPWSLAAYGRAAMEEMLGAARATLEEVLRPVDPAFRAVAFRAGSWCIAPSPDALGVLASLGIVFDMSIVAGLYYDSDELKLDYRSVDESFLPYYPVMEDARRVAESPTAIVCVPTHSFAPAKANQAVRALVRRVAGRGVPVPARARARYLAPSDVRVEEAGYTPDYSEQSPRTTGAPTRQVSDLAGIGFAQMGEMLSDVRRRAAASGRASVPVILENHTKDLGYLAPLERFAAEVAAADDLEVITSRELATALAAGEIQPRTAGATD
jgi:hypothetical protein